jgi:MFS family permease
VLLTLPSARRGWVVTVLGITQTIGWASSYYIPAVLAAPMAASFGLSPVWVFGAFSMVLVASPVVGPSAGSRIDRDGGPGILIRSNLVFATALLLLAVASSVSILVAGWAVVRIGMGMGLFEAAFASCRVAFNSGTRRVERHSLPLNVTFMRQLVGVFRCFAV